MKLQQREWGGKILTEQEALFIGWSSGTLGVCQT